MANEAARYGFKPVSPHATTREYVYSGGIISEGDPVTIIRSAGYITVAATNSGSLIGIAAQTVPAAASGKILVYDDHNTEFEGVYAGTLSQSLIGRAFDLTGSTSTFQITTTTTESAMQITAIKAGEAMSSYPMVICKINPAINQRLGVYTA